MVGLDGRMWVASALRLEEIDEFLGCDANVFNDLPQKVGRKVPSRVKWDRRDAAIRMAKLLVRPTLTDLRKAELGEHTDYFAWFEDRQLGQLSPPGRAVCR